jgi:hypothetical protein
VQPCTCSGGRLGSVGRDFGLGPRSAASSEAPFVRVTAQTSRETLHRWVCSGFTSIAEVGEQCLVQEPRCGRGRSDATAPSHGPGDPGLAANGTVAETPKRLRGRPLDARRRRKVFLRRVARAHRSRGVLGQPAWGSRGRPSPQGRSLRDPGAPETCRKRAASEEKAGAASLPAGQSG